MYIYIYYIDIDEVSWRLILQVNKHGNMDNLLNSTSIDYINKNFFGQYFLFHIVNQPFYDIDSTSTPDYKRYLYGHLGFRESSRTYTANHIFQFNKHLGYFKNTYNQPELDRAVSKGLDGFLTLEESYKTRSALIKNIMSDISAFEKGDLTKIYNAYYNYWLIYYIGKHYVHNDEFYDHYFQTDAIFPNRNPVLHCNIDSLDPKNIPPYLHQNMSMMGKLLARSFGIDYFVDKHVLFEFFKKVSFIKPNKKISPYTSYLDSRYKKY